MQTLLLFIVDFVLFSSSLLFIFLARPLSQPAEILVPFFLGIAGTRLYERIKDNWAYIWITPQLAWLTLTRSPLRISFATLIRIKIDNQYLLVRSKRTNKFQPPGGVLKFYDPNIRDHFNLVDDNAFKKVPGDEFRMTFPKGKTWKVFAFLRWFDTRKGRELDPHREFQEELIDTGILDRNIFSKPQFRYCSRVVPWIAYGTHFKVHELFLFEIFEMVLKDDQQNFLRSLEAVSSSSIYTFMNAAEIQQDGYDGHSNTRDIGNHTKHIL